MALFRDYEKDVCENSTRAVVAQEVYRVIDDGMCVLTTMDARKALAQLQTLIDKYDITHCWAEAEELK